MFCPSLTCILFQTSEWYQKKRDLKIVIITADKQEEIYFRNRIILKITGKELQYLKKDSSDWKIYYLG